VPFTLRKCDIKVRKVTILLAPSPSLSLSSLSLSLPVSLSPLFAVYVAVAVDVHFSLAYLSGSDVIEQKIKRSSTDGSGLTTTISASVIRVCDALAVEWTTSQLYWTDTTYDTISVSDLSGCNQRSFLSVGLDEPRDIVLDPDSGYHLKQ